MRLAELARRLERRCVFWWEPPDGIPNVGDYLARVVVAQLLRLADRDILDKRDRRRRLFAVGSVLHFARSGDAVWGAGINGKVTPAAHRFGTLDVRAVRGPLTRDFLLGRGIACPPVYGDPGLLAPLLFPAERLADERDAVEFLVVPHLNDAPDGYRGFGDRVLSPRQYPAAFIRRLLRARRVVSASLHGVVLAEAYGIPAVLLDSGGSEPRFKYDDYYRGTGRRHYPVAASIGAALDQPATPPPMAELAATAERLLRAFPWDLWDAAPAIVGADRPAPCDLPEPAPQA